MSKHYLIFWRYNHSVVFFVQAETVTDALWTFIANQDDDAVRQADGSLTSGRSQYPHPLAYIEAHYKSHYSWHDGSEWQIRELPGWAWQDRYSEAFCGESADGPGMVIDDCRREFVKEFPRSRAKAFLWYVAGGGAVVSFYRGRLPKQFTILKRYYWNWDGKQLTVEGWDGGYTELAEMLKVEQYRWRGPVGT